VIVPPITEGEVKILYPCSVLQKLHLEEGESFMLTFYEKNDRDLRGKGLILRERTFEEESDLTLKYRTSGKISVDEELYSTLKTENLKCEADVTYDPVRPRVVNSCSLKSSDKERQEDFLRMLDLSEVSFANLRSVQVKAQRWKLKLEGLKKKATVEVWEFRNQCLMEISSKFKDLREIQEQFKIIEREIPGKPSLVQGNKTSQVLDELKLSLPN
jgi:hypothetical protein